MGLEDLRKTRIEKLELLKKAGVNPYPAKSVFKLSEISELRKNFRKLASARKKIALAGRVMAKRGHGGIFFVDLFDGSYVLTTSGLSVASDNSKLQVFFAKDKIGDKSFEFFSESVDVGDFIAVEGKAFYTKKKEATIEVSNWEILTKSLLPLPEKWHGLSDKEETLRKRYLDILFNSETREMIQKKALFWSAVREFHLKHGFLEVETPALEVTTGGADARPFETHHNALDIDVYLRISAGELWQKRLMVSGLKKTFEIGRIFRNEGMSAEHLQDYTQCEAYWAYANFEDMYKFLQECYRFVAKRTFGTLKFKISDFNVDLGKKWPLVDYTDEIKKQTGIDIWNSTATEMGKELNNLNIEYDVSNRLRMIDALWKYCRKNIGGPAILINEPKAMSPLAKSSPKNPKITERFHFLIAGSEMGQGYSELNDPIDQRERFAAQQKLRDAGDAEAQMADFDFVEALEYGMPPTAGHGFSERLFSFLINKPVREAQIFPLMRPKE
ncbi:lysine--tRNA ligase [Candidatus Giovannonibacteria bacterium]|nr:lysine--tRNA ligase [Candidatus Giovannonibacteria bacterium]